MCFGSGLKGEDPSARFDNNLNSRPVEPKQRSSFSKMPQNDSYSPPVGPPPSHSYEPPSGPPPSQSYAPPGGPPPSHSLSSNNPYAQQSDNYTAPPGPPPSHQDDYAPPPGPPPKQEPYHDWQTAVPDTSLLPPPPSFFSGHQKSATNNATEQQAEQGEAWCHANPLRGPIPIPEEALSAVAQGECGIIKPRSYIGSIDRLRPGIWKGKTKASCPDSCITSAIPLYSVLAHSPLNTGRDKTIYYEVRIDKRNRGGGGEVSLAMGFAAPPYPTFRLPGWHRGCLAVHGDDGSKYINDRWGGKNFTTPFKAGETLGIGMALSRRDLAAPPAYSDGPVQPQVTATTPINVEIFFTRDGSRVGGWNLHEEGDAVEDLPVTGLEGLHDLYAAVGMFENVEFEIVFNEGEWMYHP